MADGSDRARPDGPQQPVPPAKDARGGMTQSLDRALRLLIVLGEHPEGMSLSEIARGAELPLATVHRLLATLRRRRFVAQGPSTHAYFLGPAISDLWESSHRQDAGQRLMIVPREMVQARDEIGETVFLSEFQGTQVRCQALVPSRHSLQLYVRTGQTMPLNAAAAARILLAWQDEARAVDLLQRTEMTVFTAQTPKTVAEVLDRLRLVRSRGFDTCDSELDDHAWAVAFPVRQALGEVVASVTIAGPEHRLQTRASRDHATTALRRAAEGMSMRLGWTGAVASDGEN